MNSWLSSMSSVYTSSIAFLYTTAHVLWAVTQDLILFPLTWGKIVLKAPYSQFTDHLTLPAPRLSLSFHTELPQNVADHSTSHRYFAFTTLAIVLLSPFIASFLTLQYLWKEKDNIPFLFQKGLDWLQAPKPASNEPQAPKNAHDISSSSKHTSRSSSPDGYRSANSHESDQDDLEDDITFRDARNKLAAALHRRHPEPPKSPKSPIQPTVQTASPMQQANQTTRPLSPLPACPQEPQALTTARKISEDNTSFSPEHSCPIHPSLELHSSENTSPREAQPHATPATAPAITSFFLEKSATSSNSEATP